MFLRFFVGCSLILHGEHLFFSDNQIGAMNELASRRNIQGVEDDRKVLLSGLEKDMEYHHERFVFALPLIGGLLFLGE
jgi:hypothetical protein